jgi:hypothetical protein
MSAKIDTLRKFKKVHQPTAGTFACVMIAKEAKMQYPNE